MFKVIDEVSRDQFDPILGPHHCFQLRPFGFQPLFALDFFPFSRLFKLGVNLWPLGRLQFELRQPALVVDRNCRFIDDRPLDVVDADVVAKDRSWYWSVISIGVPVKPMNEALGKASRMWLAKPSIKSYWLRWASSAITTMLRRSESMGCRSPFSSGKNFWMVVKTTPPESTLSFARRSARSVA